MLHQEERKENGAVQEKQEQWTSYSWYCPNCGTLVTGYRNEQGSVKAQCRKCRSFMVRTMKSRRCDTITIYPMKETQKRYV